MEKFAKAVSKMKITSIGSENIQKVTDYISLHFFKNLNTSNHIEFNRDIKGFYKKCLSNKNFLDSISKSDYIFTDGLIEHQDFAIKSDKIGYFYQKLIYYIYSINPTCKIFVSIFNLSKNFRVKLIPNFLFSLKVSKVIGPESTAQINRINLNEHHEYLKDLLKITLTKTPKAVQDEKFSNLKKILEKKSNKLII